MWLCRLLLLLLIVLVWPNPLVVVEGLCGQGADLVLPTPYTQGGLAIDPSTGDLYVADYFNNRVLRYGPVTSLTNESTPLAILSGGLQRPIGICVDLWGTLWVADSYNHRVVYWNNCSLLNGSLSPDGHFGMPPTGLPTASSMYYPDGVHVDANGTLWVADTENRRVLRFDDVRAKPGGAPADGVLGQSSFGTSGGAASPDGMGGPVSVAVDLEGGVYVVDNANNRVVSNFFFLFLFLFSNLHTRHEREHMGEEGGSLRIISITLISLL